MRGAAAEKDVVEHWGRVVVKQRNDRAVVAESSVGRLEEFSTFARDARGIK